ncbi:hypothetical protein [Plantactinospora sp. WMMB782]|uniref:hypothetical protein n=1 Tax=Plantactinospora sp. WMMB782 TaxID=3404121 RepID=UPI003B930385
MYRLHASTAFAGPAARALVGRLPEKLVAAVYEFLTTTLLWSKTLAGADRAG